ncbi:MAG: hypothetical protein GXX79_20975 [Actinomycetales bacterium]|nr:hypothetical protein [Actinomycetales bacterium]
MPSNPDPSVPAGTAVAGAGHLSRRTLLTGALGTTFGALVTVGATGVVAGCGAAGDGRTTSRYRLDWDPPTTTSPAGSAGSVTGSAAVSASAADPASATSAGVQRGQGGAPSPGGQGTLPDPPVFRLHPGEVEPACKRAAVSALRAAFTWDPPTDGGSVRAVGAALPARSAHLARDLKSLLTPAAASRLAIVYPQYGGLAADRRTASVMVSAERTYLAEAGGEVRRRGFTVDVRLNRTASGWRVTRVRVPRVPERRSELPRATRRLLGEENLVLPSAARADLAGGLVDPRVVALLTVLCRRWKLSVQEFQAGHPVNVFGTERMSNHTRGRAVDVWAIDGIPVIAQSRSAWRAVMRAAHEFGADEIGGPRDLDGVPGRPYFSDHVHQDHLHLGFDAN